MLEDKTQNLKYSPARKTVGLKNYCFKLRMSIILISFVLLFCALYFTFCVYSIAEEQFIYNDKGKRNPFMPLVTSEGRIINLDEEADSELRLEGISYSDKGSSYAIVNKAVVGIGDWIGDCQVIKIEKDKVVFLKDGETLELELKGGEE